MSFRFLTAGESHGKGLVGILEGLPANVTIDLAKMQFEMKRRKLGYGRGYRQKIEDDAVEIVTGVRHALSLGAPITLIVWNKDWKAWEDIMDSVPFEGESIRRQVHIPRPGHADYLGGRKYQHEDMRNVLERASARETAMRVAMGCIARQFLQALGIDVASRVTRIGQAVDNTDLNIAIDQLNSEVDSSPVRCIDKDAEKAMISEIDRAKEQGDTVGGHFEVYASGLPLGLGSYVQWDRRIEGKIGQAFLSLNAVKGVELGMGFEHGEVLGSEAHDEFYPGSTKESVSYKTNRAGGITGGMTTGQTLIVRAALKPIATLMKPLNSVNLKTGEEVKAHVERSDTSAVPAAAVIGESLLALVLAEEILEKFGGDSLAETKSRVDLWRKENPAE